MKFSSFMKMFGERLQEIFLESVDFLQRLWILRRHAVDLAKQLGLLLFVQLLEQFEASTLNNTKALQLLTMNEYFFTWLKYTSQ